MKNLIKNSLIGLAAHAGPHRFSSASPRLWVLMYHRILPADDARFAAEEPGMIVTPETFRQQLRILKSLFTIVSLGDWLTRREQGQPLPRRACAITFDDGWLDNYEFGFPILEAEAVPATLFTVSHMIGTTRQFWPNRFARVFGNCASETIPGFEDLSHLILRDANSSRGNFSPENVPAENVAANRESLAQSIAHLKQLSDAELDARLQIAEAQLQLTAQIAPALMSWDNVRAMQNSGLVDIGSHTCNHFRLQAALDKTILEREIRDSQQLIEERTGRPAALFCYPNGDTCATALELVGKYYRGAVTTRRGINGAATPARELLRIGIHQDIGDTPAKFEARLSGWI